jgi:2'-5' RNA ligase
MRLFVAVDLDEPLRDAVAGLIAALRTRAGRELRGVRVGWADDSRLHITVHFLGELDSDRAEAFGEAFVAPIDLPPFPLGLGGLGVFPHRGRAQILWLGVTTGADAMSRIHRAVADRLVQHGIEVETRPFTPHLTLARLREPQPVRRVEGLMRVDASAVGQTVVDRVMLYQSRLGAGGPTYTALAAAPLTGR